jgi:hypothetical protein
LKEDKFDKILYFGGVEAQRGRRNLKVEKHKKGGLNCVLRIKIFSK